MAIKSTLPEPERRALSRMAVELSRMAVDLRWMAIDLPDGGDLPDGSI